MKEDCSVFLSLLPPRYHEKLPLIKYHFSKEPYCSFNLSATMDGFWDVFHFI